MARSKSAGRWHDSLDDCAGLSAVVPQIGSGAERFGDAFGSLYDIVTALILCLAGTSVITGLTTLLPQFLLKFGMQFRWVHRWCLLLAVFAVTNIAVTIIFHADVDDQRGAYATGVL